MQDPLVFTEIRSIFAAVIHSTIGILSPFMLLALCVKHLFISPYEMSPHVVCTIVVDAYTYMHYTFIQMPDSSIYFTKPLHESVSKSREHQFYGQFEDQQHPVFTE